MTFYVPPEYLDYQGFFDHVLDMILEGNPEKEIIKASVDSLGFLFNQSYSQFSFCDLDKGNRNSLEDLLDDFESHPSKTIFLDYIQIKNVKSDSDFDVYSLYKGSQNAFIFEGYNDGIYEVTQYLENHEHTLRTCLEKKAEMVVTHHKIIEFRCVCHHPFQKKFYSRAQLLGILYVNKVWKIMRDGLCSSVSVILSSSYLQIEKENRNNQAWWCSVWKIMRDGLYSFISVILPSNHLQIKKEKWSNQAWWCSLLINGLKRFEKRERYLFKKEEVLKYCNKTLSVLLKTPKRKDPIVFLEPMVEDIKQSFNQNYPELYCEEVRKNEMYRDEIEKLKEYLKTSQSELHTKEKDSILKIIYAMAKSFGDDYTTKKHRPSTRQILDLLTEAGLALDEDTIRKIVKQAALHYAPHIEKNITPED